MRLPEDTCLLRAQAWVPVNVREPENPAGLPSHGQAPVLSPALRAPRKGPGDVAAQPVGHSHGRAVLTVENHRGFQRGPQFGDQSKWSFREGMTSLSGSIPEGRARSN